jgi:hypothetical protein
MFFKGKKMGKSFSFTNDGQNPNHYNVLGNHTTLGYNLCKNVLNYNNLRSIGQVQRKLHQELFNSNT